ncbi:glycosyltransferase family 9 protein [Rhodocyclus gracilis]|uniref:Lipopolysaccharide heptosyltransferase family protein n=1 Tax=Rhodocyclus tenuis TaxID=1066 RepID=A0A6L5JZ26_RHOTE|nr:glycosyltransferase family 9 protein [Rhodocyclus gracilis]MQY52567.1 lipopolysaccharide heptosyltransferase family protein [Rhodocyclus gracilis]
MNLETDNFTQHIAVESLQKILVIRRDNIGDLICTTPLIRGLREKFPSARIDALVNSYNRPVLEENPDINEVYSYTKAKHRERGESVIGVHLRRIKMLLQLRRRRYDLVILANGGYLPRPLGLARWVAPKHVAGFVPPPPEAHSDIIDLSTPIDETVPRHEVENIYRLLAPLGIDGPPPGLRLQPSDSARLAAIRKMADAGWDINAHQPTVAVHISARKIPQRWPAERFSELMRNLHRQIGCRFLLFWSPGDENNPLHPGDDQKAATIVDATRDLPVIPYPTHRLDDLVGGLSVCTAMICSDGGAMHVGAGLGLPMVCFFGNSDAAKWHPWGVPHRVLQKPSRDVSDITVEEAATAFSALMGEGAA